MRLLAAFALVLCCGCLREEPEILPEVKPNQHSSEVIDLRRADAFFDGNGLPVPGEKIVGRRVRLEGLKVVETPRYRGELSLIAFGFGRHGEKIEVHTRSDRKEWEQAVRSISGRFSIEGEVLSRWLEDSRNNTVNTLHLTDPRIIPDPTRVVY